MANLDGKPIRPVSRLFLVVKSRENGYGVEKVRIATNNSGVEEGDNIFIIGTVSKLGVVDLYEEPNFLVQA